MKEKGQTLIALREAPTYVARRDLPWGEKA
jgi:hypothetical protein